MTAYEEQASWGHWNTQACLVPSAYVASLTDAGACPVILPVQQGSDGALDALVRRLDGLVLTGGPDVDPAGVTGPNRIPAPRPPD